jgi:hypothetical protein
MRDVRLEQRAETKDQKATQPHCNAAMRRNKNNNPTQQKQEDGDLAIALKQMHVALQRFKRS